MKPFRCPDPSHGDEVAVLKANNDRVFECPSVHKFWRRDEEGGTRLVNLITQQSYPAEPAGGPEQPEGRPALNFMVDVPRLTGGLDFNSLSLTPPQWKLIARIDGMANLEEVRLLAGLSAQETERLIYDLVDAGLVELKRRGGARS